MTPTCTRPTGSRMACCGSIRCRCDADTARFGQLWSFRTDVSTFMRREGVDAATAEDIVAEVFMTAWRHLSAVPLDENGTRAWLCRTAANALANRRRRESYQWKVKWRATLDRSPSGPCNSTAPFERVELLDTFWSLSSPDRHVLWLAAVAGLTGTDLANALGCSRTAANVRLTRARQRLQAAIDRELG